MTRPSLEALFAGCILLLTGGSFWVLSIAAQEPFVTFKTHEAFLQIGVGMIVLTLWPIVALVLCIAVARRAIRRGWLLSLIWMAFAFALVAPCPSKYVQDISRYVVQRR